MIRLKTDREAIAIIGAILIMLIASTLGLAAASLLGADTGSSLNYMNSQEAFFIAEGGLECYLEQLQLQGSSWASPPAKPANEPLGKGRFTITTSNEQADSIEVTSTASLGGIGGETVTRVVKITAMRQASIPEAFYYVQHSGKKIRFDGSTQGTVIGDISAVNSVDGEGGMAISGTITEGSSVSMPGVDYSGYQSIADHVITGDFTFQENHTYNGIYYITGNTIFQDGVTLNGSVICPNSNRRIDMYNRDRITVNPSGNYPALVAAGDITIRNAERIDINGLVYSEKTINLRDTVRSDFNGTLICSDNMVVRDTWRLNLTYDATIASSPPPYFDGGGSQTVGVSGWDELY